MRARKLLFAGLGAAGLALYLWPALAAPVVLWSDSRIDLDWARRGVGILDAPPQRDPRDPPHPAKPGYLLFLRAASRAIPPLGEERSIVVTQSLLLWASIVVVSLYLGRRRGAGFGLSAYLLLLLFLRLRDTASAVMSEALSAVILLPAAALLLEPCRRPAAPALIGLTTGALFWVRPNVGAILFLVAAFLLAGRALRPVALLTASFALMVVPLWLSTRPGSNRDESRGLSYALLYGSADYYWAPSLGSWPSSPEEKQNARLARERALNRWVALLRSRGEDGRRQLFWRAAHGLLGTEFYDARWSHLYRAADTIVRIVCPFLVIATLALSLSFPFAAGQARWNGGAYLLLALLVTQNVLLGSHPRLVLPFLPMLLLIGLAAAFSHPWKRPRRALIPVLLFGGLVAFAAIQRGALDWEGGQIEAEGVTLRQRIPRGALPRQGPATLHLRVAAPVLPTGAHMRVTGRDAEELYSSLTDGDRQRPDIHFAIPQWLLDANAQRSVELRIVSAGSYDRFHFLRFPVVPPPWGSAARRDGSSELSPSTGIRSGSLDWWTHAGAH